MIALVALVVTSPAVFTEKLENGAWIVAIQIEGAHTFAAETFIRAGSAFESASDSGAAHLLEHLLFADGGADEMAENAGLLLNATTYREFMRLHIAGPAEAWQSGVRSVAHLLRKPKASAAEAEWKVIGEEDALVRLDPDEAIHRTLWQSAADGTPWANLPMGNVAAVAPSQFDRVHERHVVGTNVVAVVAGNLAGQEALVELRKLYKQLPKGSPQSPPQIPKWRGELRGALGTRYGIAAPVAGYDSPVEYLSAEVAIEALCSPLRLQPLGLEAKSFLVPSSRGSLAVLSFAAVDGAPGLEPRASRAITPPISEGEYADALSRVRARYKSSSSTGQALLAGLSILFTGRTIDFAAGVDGVTRAQVDAVAGDFVK